MTGLPSRNARCCREGEWAEAGGDVKAFETADVLVAAVMRDTCLRRSVVTT